MRRVSLRVSLAGLLCVAASAICSTAHAKQEPDFDMSRAAKGCWFRGAMGHSFDAVDVSMTTAFPVQGSPGRFLIRVWPVGGDGILLNVAGSVAIDRLDEAVDQVLALVEKCRRERWANLY